MCSRSTPTPQRATARARVRSGIALATSGSHRARPPRCPPRPPGTSVRNSAYANGRRRTPAPPPWIRRRAGLGRQSGLSALAPSRAPSACTLLASIRAETTPRASSSWRLPGTKPSIDLAVWRRPPCRSTSRTRACPLWPVHRREAAMSLGRHTAVRGARLLSDRVLRWPASSAGGRMDGLTISLGSIPYE